ncbi:MAG: hypothetical protein K5790_04365 [Nitrosopumilus sp.]|nr:hypothetical protein [Nitrosopumilus sp.]MCV0392513.1 hypothetical protein [Nitrosopumilus sp.]
MTNIEIIANKVSEFIAKNLRGNTPFQNTAELIAYIAYKESRKKIEK